MTMSTRDLDLLQQARRLLREEAASIAGLADQLDEGFTRLIEALVAIEGKVVTTGVGTSGVVAERFAHLLSVCGTPAFYLPTHDALHGGIGAVVSGDVVIAFSKSGLAKELETLAREFVRRDIAVIGVTESPDSPFARAVTTVVEIHTVPAGADLDGLVSTASSLVASAWSDAVVAALKRARGFTAEDVIALHPGGGVGRRRGGSTR